MRLQHDLARVVVVLEQHLALLLSERGQREHSRRIADCEQAEAVVAGGHRVKQLQVREAIHVGLELERHDDAIAAKAHCSDLRLED